MGESGRARAFAPLVELARRGRERWCPRPIWPNFNDFLKYSKISQSGEVNGSEMIRGV
jgi:hypothetical protein